MKGSEFTKVKYKYIPKNIRLKYNINKLVRDRSFTSIYLS